MFPPVYRTLRASPAVVAEVGDRIGRHGSVPQGTSPLYITWQIVIGQPYDQLSGPPCGDFTTVQLDCWGDPDADGDAGVERLALAVRDALDAVGIANRIVMDTRDAQTQFYRVCIEADFINSR